MGHHHHGHAVGGQRAHEVQHLTHHLRVQRRGGFVEQQYLRLHGQGADDGDALLLSAGEHIGVFIGLIRQTDALQEGHGLLPGLLRRFLFQGHRGHGDVLQHGLMGKEIEVLEHHTHFLAVKVDVHGFVRQIRTVEVDDTGGRLLQ